MSLLRTPTHGFTLNFSSAAAAAEWNSLSRESNPEIFYEGLLRLGGRLETEDRLDEASRIYAAIVEPPNGEEPTGPCREIRRRAQLRLDAMAGTGASGLRAELLLRRLSRDVMEPSGLAGLTLASAVFRATRFAALSGLIASPSVNFLTRGFGARAAASLLGFGVEATVFPLATRGAAFALGRDLDWSTGAVGRDIASSFLVLGAMKSAAWAVGGLAAARPGPGSALWQQAGMFAGINLGHGLEIAAGLRPHRDGATNLVDSLGMLIQFHAAGRLAQGLMGSGFRTWEAGLEVGTRALAATPRRTGGWRLGFGIEAIPAWTGTSGRGSSRENPFPLEVLMMTGRHDGKDGNPPPERPSAPPSASLIVPPLDTIEDYRIYRESVRRNIRESIWAFTYLYNESQERPLLGFDGMLHARLNKIRGQLQTAQDHFDLLQASGLRTLHEPENFPAALRILEPLPAMLARELRKSGMTHTLATNLRRHLERAWMQFDPENSQGLNGLRENLPEITPSRLHPASATLEQIRGMLLGGAVGDAFGAPYEFLSPTEIANRSIDPNHYLVKGNRKAGTWTDDTLLVLATLDALLAAEAVVPRQLGEVFGRLGPHQKERGFGPATKTAIQRLHRGQAWGRSGLEAAETNGAAMRIAPVAAFSYRSWDALRRDCLLAGQITHAGYESLSGGLGVAFILAKILRGEFRPATIIEETRRFIGPGQFSRAMYQVQKLLDQDVPTEVAFLALGTSSLVWESVPSAIYSFLRNPVDYRRMLTTLVAAGGDTDTMAAIAGALSGALNGENAIPASLRRDLESADAIRDRADRFFQLLNGSINK